MRRVSHDSSLFKARTSIGGVIGIKCSRSGNEKERRALLFLSLPEEEIDVEKVK